MPVEPVECKHCHEQIVFLPAVWGAARPRKPYEPQDVPVDDVPATERYVYSKRRGGVILLDADTPPERLPRRVLVPHRCGYAQSLELYSNRLVELVDGEAEGLGGALVGWIKSGPDAARPQSPRLANLGYRRGFGKKPKPE